MRKKRILKEILEYSRLILFTLIFVYFVNDKLIANAQVPTGSMECTIMTDSRIIINKLAYICDPPNRGDIVAFQCPDERPDSVPYLKRIIALPGETIEGRDGNIYIDGQQIQEDYIKEPISQDFGPYTIPDHCYFMMGDNRNNSWDSRYWKNKYVDESAIIGKAAFEYYPEIKRLDN